MPKTPSIRLFHLIKSLSGSEKRYFKIYIKKDGDSKYFRLFNAIEQQEEFDEKELIGKVYGADKIQSRKYSELKAYLFDLILKSLQQYDEQKSIDYQLKGILLSVQVLYRRSLFSDSIHMVKRAKKAAQKYERFSMLLEVLDWEKKIAYANSDISYFDRHLQQITTEEDVCLQKMENLKVLQRLFFQMYVLARKNTSQKEAQLKQVMEIKSHELMQDETQALSHRARIFHYRTLAIIGYYLKDIQQFYENSKRIIELLEERPTLLKEDASQYIAALSNFAGSCGALKKYNEVRNSLEKLRKVKPSTKDDVLKIHQLYYNNYFRMCIDTGDFEQGLQILEQHKKDAKQYKREMFLNNFHFQYFYIYFGVERYEESLDYLNQWLSLPKSIEQQDLQNLARLLNLIIHFELKHYLLLDSLLRSTQRLLQKRKKLHPLEQLLLYAIRQGIKTQNKRDLERLFSEVSEEAEALKLTTKESSLLRFFDFKAWIESKKTGRSFATIVRENKLS